MSVQVNTWKIKDSGDRTVFESGAVRDCPVGKGRCDLLPLKEIEEWIKYSKYEVGILETLNHINEHYYNSTTIDDTDKTFYIESLYSVLNCFLCYTWLDYISNSDEIMIDLVGDCSDFKKTKATAILEVSKHFEDGAAKYGDNNWRKGIPVNRYIDSAIRHYIKVLRGDTDERHDRAFMWNVLCLAWTIRNIAV